VTTAPGRKRDAARTRAELLTVATEAFAESGYSGTGVEEIARRTQMTKRGIYYYYGSKKDLYVAVLEAAYRGIREAEQSVHVGDLPPLEALRRIAERTYDHHLDHSSFIRLVAIENIHRGEFIEGIDGLRELNQNALGVLDDILSRGQADGTFRRGVDALDVHIVISAYCFFQVANRHTFGFLFGRDMLDPSLRDHHRSMIGDVVAAWLESRD